MRKTRSKKGFTLAELLIVVAVIAILVAIAIPVFNTQLDKARAAVDQANLRSASSMAASDYLMFSRSGAQTYYFNKTSSQATDGGTDNLSINYTDAKAGTLSTSKGDITGQSTDNKEKTIVVTVTDGKVTSASWTAIK